MVLLHKNMVLWVYGDLLLLISYHENMVLLQYRFIILTNIIEDTN